MEILNRKASHEYFILETYEAGIALTGTEIKSIRQGKMNIKDSYVVIKNNEAFLLNTTISLYDEGNRFNHLENRTRKLLLHKKEILKLRDSVEKEGCTIIPLKAYFVKNKVKLQIGLVRGKKIYDKRETIKKKTIEREIAQNYKLR